MKHASLVALWSCGVGLGLAGAAPTAKSDDSPAPKIEHQPSTTDLLDDQRKSVDVAKLDAAIKKSDAALIACYKKALARDPNLGNTGADISIELSLQPNGTVKDIEVFGIEEEMNTCLEAVAAKWKFARTTAKGPIRVTHPMQIYIGEKVETPIVTFGAVQGGLQEGGGGWGAIGAGPYGTVGSGRYGTIGTASGTGSPPGKGPTPLTKISAVKAEGALDVAIVRRYVKRNLAKLNYCYEKQLLVDAKLAGKLTATFGIDAAGKVTEATAAGIKSKTVEECVVTVLNSIEYPKPTSGTVKATLVLAYGRTGG